jgi:hypothetical protein
LIKEEKMADQDGEEDTGEEYFVLNIFLQISQVKFFTFSPLS